MTGELEGRVALVTGGGRGLGEIMAKALSGAGAAVAVVSRSQGDLDRVSSEIASVGGRALAVAADVTAREQVERAVTETEKVLGPPDILVNNAGVDGPFGPVGVVDPDEWWRAQAVHVLGPMYFMSRVVPGMAERGGGRVISICSMAGVLPVPNMSAYAVGKCTEIRLTQQVAAEWGGKGIVAFAIEPGTILTGMADNTLNSIEAQRWVPDGIDYLKSITKAQSAASAARLVDMVTSLAGGRYDGLSGRYLEPGDDFDALLHQENPAAARAAPPLPDTGDE
jgi:NAD(P)-dependent dehydrogenase (short-subunit alcohol dehydrogenase family)